MTSFEILLTKIICGKGPPLRCAIGLTPDAQKEIVNLLDRFGSRKVNELLVLRCECGCGPQTPAPGPAPSPPGSPAVPVSVVTPSTPSTPTTPANPPSIEIPDCNTLPNIPPEE